MESVARLSSAERRELFAETAARKGMTSAIVEKDFWVCWTLGRLFASDEVMGAGGTLGRETKSKVEVIISISGKRRNEAMFFI